MSTIKSIDSKREEFRKYLEKAGVIDVMTKVLVGLYEEPEKPSDALDYFKKTVGTSVPDKADVEALKNDISSLNEKLALLKEENDELKKKLAIYEANNSTEVVSSSES